MNAFEAWIAKWNFKKIAITYLILAILAGIACLTAIGVVFQERLSFAWQYSNLHEAVEETDPVNLQDRMDQLAASSTNVVDILVLDDANNVLYSAKQSIFAQEQLHLTPVPNSSHYFTSNQTEQVVFKYVEEEEFMLASVFSHDFGEILQEYDEASFFQPGFSQTTVYMLNYLGNPDSGNKIYLINNPTTVASGMLTLKITAVVFTVFFMVYWVLVALWVYQNAAKAKLYPLFWGIITLLTNVVGLLVYQIYKRGNLTCPSCGLSQSKQHLYCVACGNKIGKTCPSCGAHLNQKDVYCPSCGQKQSQQP